MTLTCKNLYRLLALLCTLCASVPAVAANATAASSRAPGAATQLAPESSQVPIARTVIEVTQRHHYPAEKLDAEFAHNLLKEYVDTLDPGRLFFTQQDVDQFDTAYADPLPDDLSQGNLEPAFAIYARYNTRVQQRFRYALQLLVKEPNFDGKDSYRFSRRHAPRAVDNAALDQLWQARVKSDALVILLTGKTWDETAKTLHKRYERMLHTIEQTTSNDVFSIYLNAYAQAQDPHSSYFSPFESQQFDIEMSLHLEGIGAELTETDGYASIVRLLPGGPAAKNGVLKPGDRITAVGQGKDGKLIDVMDWRLDDVVKKIRGPKGSTVRLKILPAGTLPGGDEKILPLARNTVELNAQRAHGHTVLAKRGNNVYKIGIIDIPSFYEDFDANSDSTNSPSVTSDVRRIVAGMKKKNVSGILLDLRNDGGGSLQQAAALTGLFIPHGPVVQVQDRRGSTQVIPVPKSEKMVWKGPLALLVNRSSASATEIFSGALKDYGRALVLGSRTWGKGTVQTLIPLQNFLPAVKGGELKLTIAQFFRVNGESTQRRGVQPDISILSATDDKVFGESAYPNALPWKRIPAAAHTLLDDGIEETLPAVEKYFEDTIQKQPQYQLFEREIRAQRTTNARTHVSLNLNERKVERSQQRAQKLTFANDWRKLNGEPLFKTAKAAASAKFSAADTALDASTELLSEYIAVASDHAPDLSKLVTAIPARELTLCLRGSNSQATSINCKRGDRHRAASGVFYPPTPAPDGSD